MSWSFVLLILYSCGSYEHVSEFKADDKKHSFVLKLVSDHPYLSEYKRILIVLKNRQVTAQQELFPDTGGYADTNLYSCGKNKYLVLGYFDSWLIDATESSIYKGKCSDEKKMYLGAFRVDESNPWSFYPKALSAEQSYVVKGG